MSSLYVLYIYIQRSCLPLWAKRGLQKEAGGELGGSGWRDAKSVDAIQLHAISRQQGQLGRAGGCRGWRRDSPICASTADGCGVPLVSSDGTRVGTGGCDQSEVVGFLTAQVRGSGRGSVSVGFRVCMAQGLLVQGLLVQGLLVQGLLVQGPLVQGPLVQGLLVQGLLFQGLRAASGFVRTERRRHRAFPRVAIMAAGKSDD